MHILYRIILGIITLLQAVSRKWWGKLKKTHLFK